MSNTTKQTFALGCIDNALHAVFRSSQCENRYIVSPTLTRWTDLYTRFPNLHKFEFGHVDFYCEDSDGKFFLFANADCAFPPMAIIRANSFESAYATFLCEFEKFVKIDDSNLSDYNDSEALSYNDNGTPIDDSAVNGFEVYLDSVHFE